MMNNKYVNQSIKHLLLLINRLILNIFMGKWERYCHDSVLSQLKFAIFVFVKYLALFCNYFAIQFIFLMHLYDGLSVQFWAVLFVIIISYRLS